MRRKIFLISEIGGDMRGHPTITRVRVTFSKPWNVSAYETVKEHTINISDSEVDRIMNLDKEYLIKMAAKQVALLLKLNARQVAEALTMLSMVKNGEIQDGDSEQSNVQPDGEAAGFANP